MKRQQRKPTRVRLVKAVRNASNDDELPDWAQGPGGEDTKETK